MNVIHVITGLNAGGAQKVLLRLILATPEYHHTVISLTKGGDLKGEFESLDVAIHELHFKFHNLLSILLQLHRILTSTKPKLVQTWLYHADLVGVYISTIYRKYPVFWNIRNSTLENAKFTTRLIVRILSMCSWYFPEKIISCSKRSTKIHVGMGYDASRFVHIPNGIRVQDYLEPNIADLNLRSKLNIDQQTFVIGCVARYHPQKDHITLIRAFYNVSQRFNDCALILVGKGIPYAKPLNELCNKLNLQDKVHFLDYVEDVAPLYRSLDLKVLSSSSGEAFPNVLIEAMAAGVLCIASDVGDAKYIISNSIFSFPPRNIRLLSDRIECIIMMKNDDPKEYIKLADENKTSVSERFSIERMAESYSYIWSQE